jgi:hypothetical protein
MVVARASSRLAAPERRTNSSPNCFLNASLLPDRLNSSKSLNISMAASSDHCSLVIISNAYLSVDRLRRSQTSFKIVLDLRQEPFEHVGLSFARQHLCL